jgi:hypothetical protein
MPLPKVTGNYNWTELPDARVNKILVVGRSQGSGQPGLFPNEPLQLAVKSPVRLDALFACRRSGQAESTAGLGRKYRLLLLVYTCYVFRSSAPGEKTGGGLGRPGRGKWKRNG